MKARVQLRWKVLRLSQPPQVFLCSVATVSILRHGLADKGHMCLLAMQVLEAMTAAAIKEDNGKRAEVGRPDPRVLMSRRSTQRMALKHEQVGAAELKASSAGSHHLSMGWLRFGITGNLFLVQLHIVLSFNQVQFVFNHQCLTIHVY
jgi:hypothetical protein